MNQVAASRERSTHHWRRTRKNSDCDTEDFKFEVCTLGQIGASSFGAFAFAALPLLAEGIVGSIPKLLSQSLGAAVRLVALLNPSLQINPRSVSAIFLGSFFGCALAWEVLRSPSAHRALDSSATIALLLSSLSAAVCSYASNILLVDPARWNDTATKKKGVDTRFDDSQQQKVFTGATGAGRDIKDSV